MDGGTGALGLQNSGNLQSWNFSMGIKGIAENVYSVLHIPLSKNVNSKKVIFMFEHDRVCINS